MNLWWVAYNQAKADPEWQALYLQLSSLNPRTDGLTADERLDIRTALIREMYRIEKRYENKVGAGD